ncbi:MAG TPA: hypothetical protein VGM05_26630 [Planctomycetaceae bacterium]
MATPPEVPAGAHESAVPVVKASADSNPEQSGAPVTPSDASKPDTEAAAGDASAVDLTRYYGLKAERFDTVKTYPWPAMPRGSQKFAGVPLEIGGMFCLYGEENTKRGMKYPEEITGIAVGRPFEILYLCHMAFFEAPPETALCKLRFQYDDGTTESDQVLCGSDVRDWFVNTPDEELGPSGKRSTLAWSSDVVTNGRPQKIRICLTAIANPHPDKTVQTVDLISTKSRAASCILAITTGTAGLMQPDTR